ncbi:MAG: histidine kinase [Lewinella sp.]
MKNLTLLLSLTVLFLAVQNCTSDLPGPTSTPPASAPNVDFIRSEMVSSGIDSQRITELVVYLRPFLFSTLADQKLENWFVSKKAWVDTFEDAQNILYVADLTYADYLKTGDLAAAAKVKNAVSRIYAKNGNFPDAIKASQLGFELAKRAKDSVSIGWNLTAMSGYFGMLSDLKTGEEYGTRALQLARSINTPEMEASILNVLGGIKSYQLEYDSAIVLMKQSILMSRENNLPEIEKKGIINVSFNYNRLGLFDESIEFLKENVDFSQIPPSISNIFLCYNLQSAYLGMQDFEKANFYLDLGCKMANEFGFVYAQLHCEKYSTVLYKEQGLHQEALVASERSMEIQAKLTGAEQVRDIQSLKTRLRLLEKDLEIERLNQASNERKQAYQKRFVWFIIVIGFLAFFTPVIYFIMRNRHRVKSAVQQKKLAETKLQVLQSQINPHFIFNALAGVQNYILKSEKMKAYKYLGRFATLLRTITKSSTQIHIELDQEIQFIESYLDMEKLRFRDDFVYSLNVDPSLKGIMVIIPCMIIQPVVENALVHGLVDLNRQGVLKIEVKSCLDKAGICCVVSDNGRGRKASKEVAKKQDSKDHLSIATINTNKRLDFLRFLGYENVGMEIEDIYTNNEPAGTRVSLFLPILKKDEVSLG